MALEFLILKVNQTTCSGIASSGFQISSTNWTLRLGGLELQYSFQDIPEVGGELKCSIA